MRPKASLPTKGSIILHINEILNSGLDDVLAPGNTAGRYGTNYYGTTCEILEDEKDLRRAGLRPNI
jgi:hypothetical protein